MPRVSKYFGATQLIRDVAAILRALPDSPPRWRMRLAPAPESGVGALMRGRAHARNRFQALQQFLVGARQLLAARIRCARDSASPAEHGRAESPDRDAREIRQMADKQAGGAQQHHREAPPAPPPGSFRNSRRSLVSPDLPTSRSEDAGAVERAARRAPVRTARRSRARRPAVKSSTCMSGRTGISSAAAPIIAPDVMIRTSAPAPKYARKTPSRLPDADSSRDSVRAWRTRRKPAGAQGDAHRHFLLPGGSTRQQHTGDIRARDQQQQRHHGHQHQQRLGELIAQVRQDRRPPAPLQSSSGE